MNELTLTLFEALFPPFPQILFLFMTLANLSDSPSLPSPSRGQ